MTIVCVDNTLTAYGAKGADYNSTYVGGKGGSSTTSLGKGGGAATQIYLTRNGSKVLLITAGGGICYSPKVCGGNLVQTDWEEIGGWYGHWDEECDNVKEVTLYIEKIDEMIDRKRRLLEE